MSTILVPKQTKIQDLTDFKAGDLNNLTLLLIMNNIPQDPQTPLATLIANEATFGGYARKTAIALTGPVVPPGGDPELLTPLISFIYGGVAPTNIIYGYAVIDNAVTQVWWWEMFDSPVPLAHNLDALEFIAKYNIGPSTAGAVVVG